MIPLLTFTTHDFRDVMAELLQGHLGAGALSTVFPGFSLDPRRYRGILSA